MVSPFSFEKSWGWEDQSFIESWDYIRFSLIRKVLLDLEVLFVSFTGCFVFVVGCWFCYHKFPSSHFECFSIWIMNWINDLLSFLQGLFVTSSSRRLPWSKRLKLKQCLTKHHMIGRTDWHCLVKRNACLRCRNVNSGDGN